MLWSHLEIVNKIHMLANVDEISALTDPNQDTKRVIDAVNLAQQDLARLKPWKVLFKVSTFSTVSGSRTLALDSTFDPNGRIIRVYRTSTSYTRIRFQNPSRWENRTRTTVTGSPDGYRWGEIVTATGLPILELDPRPTSVLTVTIEHLQLPTKVTASNGDSYPLMPAEAIIYDAATIYLNIAGDQLTEMKERRNSAVANLAVIDHNKGDRMRQGKFRGSYVYDSLPDYDNTWNRLA